MHANDMQTRCLPTGNKNGLLLPNSTTDQGEQLSSCINQMDVRDWAPLTQLASARAELLHMRNSLPDEVVVQRIDERLSALGNCITCNDYVGLVHPDIDKVLLCGLAMPRLVLQACQRCCLQSHDIEHGTLL